MSQRMEQSGRAIGWRAAAWTVVIAIVLLIPLIAMQFTEEVAWDTFDFVAAGVMLGGAALTYELASRKAASVAYRGGVGVGVAAAFLLVWVTGAVGIIGPETEDANMMYAGVLAIGFVGAFVSCFQARGMARTLFAMAGAQVLIAVIAIRAGWGVTDPLWPLDLIGATSFFTALWLLSAWLFRKAARDSVDA